jgi:hypothetical protein
MLRLWKFLNLNLQKKRDERIQFGELNLFRFVYFPAILKFSGHIEKLKKEIAELEK